MNTNKVRNLAARTTELTRLIIHEQSPQNQVLINESKKLAGRNF